MEFKIRFVQLKSGIYQVQQGQVEFDNRPCGISYVKKWDVLVESYNRDKAYTAYEAEKNKHLADVIKVFEEFSFNKKE